MIDPAHIRRPLGPDMLQRIGEYLYDHPTRWKTKMAYDLQTGVNTINNWAARPQRRGVPGPAVVALRLLVERKLVREMF